MKEMIFFRRSFAPSLFLGLLTDTFLIKHLLPDGLFRMSYPVLRLLPSALLNACLCYAVALFIKYLFYHVKQLHKVFGEPSLLDVRLGFFCGGLSVFMRLFPVALLTGFFVAALALLQIRSFIRQMRYFLVPNRYITHHDVIKFFIFFLEVVILFSLINLIFSVIDNPVVAASEDILTGRVVVFETHHLLNSLYFTIILMTTVGFGDFIPLSFPAKMIVVLECLTSYLMLALMIGLLTRGIRLDHPKMRAVRQSGVKGSVILKNKRISK